MIGRATIQITMPTLITAAPIIILTTPTTLYVEYFHFVIYIIHIIIPQILFICEESK